MLLLSSSSAFLGINGERAAAAAAQPSSAAARHVRAPLSQPEPLKDNNTYLSPRYQRREGSSHSHSRRPPPPATRVHACAPSQPEPRKDIYNRHLSWAKTANPRQVTDAPVSTRPRTGMPSRVNRPVMDGPTAHPTGVTLAFGDPPSSLNAPGGGALAAFWCRKLENLSSWWSMSGLSGLLP